MPSVDTLLKVVYMKSVVPMQAWTLLFVVPHDKHTQKK